jgi:hypothetical protein
MAQPSTARGRLQALPQAPHAVGVLLRLVSQPLPGAPSQSAKPALQLPTAQDPPRHTAVALARAHALPQAPQ